MTKKVYVGVQSAVYGTVSPLIRYHNGKIVYVKPTFKAGKCYDLLGSRVVDFDPNKLSLPSTPAHSPGKLCRMELSDDEFYPFSDWFLLSRIKARKKESDDFDKLLQEDFCFGLVDYKKASGKNITDKKIQQFYTQFVSDYHLPMELAVPYITKFLDKAGNHMKAKEWESAIQDLMTKKSDDFPIISKQVVMDVCRSCGTQTPQTHTSNVTFGEHKDVYSMLDTPCSNCGAEDFTQVLVLDCLYELNSITVQVKAQEPLDDESYSDEYIDEEEEGDY